MSPGLEDVQTKDNRGNKLYTAQGCASFATRTTQFAAGPWIGVELDVEHISEGFLVHAGRGAGHQYDMACLQDTPDGKNDGTIQGERLVGRYGRT